MSDQARPEKICVNCGIARAAAHVADAGWTLNAPFFAST